MRVNIMRKNNASCALVMDLLHVFIASAEYYQYSRPLMSHICLPLQTITALDFTCVVTFRLCLCQCSRVRWISYRFYIHTAGHDAIFAQI